MRPSPPLMLTHPAGYAQMATLACKWLNMLDSAPIETPGNVPAVPVNEFTLLQVRAVQQTGRSC